MNLTHEKIEAYAYGLYLERRESEGSALEDWLDAEEEVKRGCAKCIEKNTLTRSHRQR